MEEENIHMRIITFLTRNNFEKNLDKVLETPKSLFNSKMNLS